MKLNFLLKRLFAFLAAIALHQLAFAQTTVTGKVTDQSSGAPLSNVNVTVKGTTRGTTTNDNGIFSLALQQGDAILVFSSTGFAETEIEINGRSSIDVTLSTSSTKLSEVVVVGYGTQSRRDLTGAVASVKGDAILFAPPR